MSSYYEQIRWNLSQARLSPMHWKVWLLSAMGIFLDGYDLFVISIALPLIIKEFAPSPALQGLIGSSAILGMILGAMVGGRLTDLYGRRSIYIIDLFLFCLFTILCAFSHSIAFLIACRFFLGIGIGADYPICASYVSEIMPARIRGKMLIAAFSFQALGAITAAIAGLFIMTEVPHVSAWRWILASGAAPAFITLFFRMRVFESPFWLASHGRAPEAFQVLKTLGIHHPILQETTETRQATPSLFKRPYLKPTILSGIPWFLMDIPAYGVGVFTPILLGSMIVKDGNEATIAGIFSSVAGTAFLDLFLLLGFFLNITLVERIGRIKLQLIGFLGMSLGLCLLFFTSLKLGLTSDTSLIFAGFICFNLFLNMGPAATTFTIPAEVFPTKMRASGHGFAAGLAKLGAFLGIFFLPILQHTVGLPITLIFLALTCLWGLIITAFFAIETKGRLLN